MARGWESKSVEEQIESARGRGQAPKAVATVDQMATERKCDSLLLHRTRVLSDLANCHGDRYRKTLTDGLTFLETQLTELGWRPSE